MAVAGRVLMIPAGVWKSGTSYGMLDVVIHNGSSYVAKKQINNSTVAPPSASSDWQLLAQGFDATNMVTKSMIVNNLLTTNPNTVLSGPMGKSLKDQLDTLNSNLANLFQLNNYGQVAFGASADAISMSMQHSEKIVQLKFYPVSSTLYLAFYNGTSWAQEQLLADFSK